jgi:hypothetical protein
LWAFSRRSPSFGVQRPCWSLRLHFALVFRRNRRPGAVRRRWRWLVELPSLRRHHLYTGRHEVIATYQTLLRKSRRKVLRFGYLGVGDHTIIVEVSRLELFSTFSLDGCGVLLCKGRNGGQQYGCQDGCTHGDRLWLGGLPLLSAPHRIWFRRASGLLGTAQGVGLDGPHVCQDRTRGMVHSSPPRPSRSHGTSTQIGATRRPQPCPAR